MDRQQQIVVSVLGLILVIVASQAILPERYVPEAQEEVAAEPCIGKPIPVDFPYMGNVAEPWSCKPQCEDGQPRFILYSNGKATQCETPPGCNDFGEDRGVTCEPPPVSR